MNPRTHNDPERLQALYRLEILDTPLDGSFNKITELTAQIFNVPIALITMVDTDRIWFKSHFGIDVDQIGMAPGLCASAILSDEVYLVEDARRDPRCLANPLVADSFGLQFYAAAPLTTKDGYNLGTFCIIDKRPRFINSDQQKILKLMASIVMDQFELRLQARHIMKESQELQQEQEKSIH